jgi:hypothetical protein
MLPSLRLVPAFQGDKVTVNSLLVINCRVVGKREITRVLKVHFQNSPSSASDLNLLQADFSLLI